MSENSILSLDDKQTTAGGAAQIDAAKYEQFMRDVKSKQNLTLAVVGGFAASVVAAVLWALLTYATNYKIGFAAVGVGFLVGYAVRFFGKGISPAFGIVGAVFALFGCVFGDFLATIIAASQIEGASASMIFTALLSSPGIVLEILQESFSPMDLLFYGIAVYEGYKYSFLQIGAEELSTLQTSSFTPPAPPAAATLAATTETAPPETEKREE